MSVPERVPKNYIDEARKDLIEQMELESSSEELFKLSIDLLRQYGEGIRILGFKHLIMNHSANSAEPPIDISIKSGPNLDKSKAVRIFIQERTLTVRSTGKGENKRFTSYYVSGRYAVDESETVKGYLSALKQVAKEKEAVSLEKST